jgi:hypothetical protein
LGPSAPTPPRGLEGNRKDLRRISRIGADSEDSQSEGVDERGVAVVEALEGLTIAARDLLDQTGRVVPPLGTHANFVSQAARR